MDNINFATAIMIGLYFFPTILALINRGASVSDKLAAFVLNVMFGWTVIGWFFVFAYATSNHKHAALVRKAKDDFYLREATKQTPN